MTLNLQQDEYISLGGREAGVRVTITPPDTRPLPDEDGITIQPGVVTSIGLRFVSPHFFPECSLNHRPLVLTK